jgi:hypothetical protein
VQAHATRRQAVEVMEQAHWGQVESRPASRWRLGWSWCSLLPPGFPAVPQYLNRTIARPRAKPFSSAFVIQLGFLERPASAQMSQVSGYGANSAFSPPGQDHRRTLLVNAARGRCLRRRWRLADRRIARAAGSVLAL